MASSIEVRSVLETAAPEADEVVVDYMVEMLSEIQECTKTESMNRQQVLDEILAATMFLEDRTDDREEIANKLLGIVYRSESPKDHVAPHKQSNVRQSVDANSKVSISMASATSTASPLNNSAGLASGFARVNPATGKAIVNDTLQKPAMSKEELKKKKRQERVERHARKNSQQETTSSSSDSDTAPVLASTKEGHHTISVSAEEMKRAALLGAEVMSSNDGRMGIVEDENGGITEGVVAGAWRGEVHGAAGGDSREICVHQLTLTHGPTELLTQAVLRLHYGTHYGLVGRNGTGKTTLLQRLAAHQVPGISRELRIQLVQQEALPLELSTLESVKSSDSRKAAIEAEVERLMEIASRTENENVASESSQQLEVLMDKLAVFRTEEEEDRDAQMILRGLGFTSDMISAPTNNLSGGWRMRLALAQALFIKPDVLLLDEPTNHLDLEGILWLQDYLNDYEGTVVVVSHDRAFLDTVVEETIHLQQNQLKYYPGNYSDFEKAREDKIKKMDRLQDNLDRRKAQMESSIEKMTKAASVKNKAKVTAGGTKLSRAKGDEKKLKQAGQRKLRLLHVGLDKTEDGKKFNGQKHSRRVGSAADNAGGWKNGKMSAGSVREHVDSEIRFSFPGSGVPDSHVADAATPLLQIREVSFRWNENSPYLFRRVDTSLSRNSRIGILGSNGSGKTTLLNLIRQTLFPTEGEVYCPPSLRVAMFAQHHVDRLQLDKTPLEHIQQKHDLSEQTARAELAAFGVHPGIATRPMGTLSGGQLSRVVFADVSCSRPHILLLDEPTNFLDMDSREALKIALKEYPGAVLLISHDQDLLKDVCKEFWVVTGSEGLRSSDPTTSSTGLEVFYGEDGFNRYVQLLQQNE
eukprot:gb/GECG01015621.1/.p1 GENE.gb/GECG01015621.1/~~gb/GECG01015621.1/.p1  ORF type:complete len:867 (+),score=127.17 gb/GECG01015621.1/:1-2601(+)